MIEDAFPQRLRASCCLLPNAKPGTAFFWNHYTISSRLPLSLQRPAETDLSTKRLEVSSEKL